MNISEAVIWAACCYGYVCYDYFFFLSSIAVVVVVVYCVHFDSSPHKFTQRSSYFDGEKNVFLLFLFISVSV